MNQELLRTVADAFLPWMAEILVRSLVLLVLAGLVLLFLRRSSAALRHLVLVLTFLSLLALPLLSLLLPSWSPPLRAHPLPVRPAMQHTAPRRAVNVSASVFAPQAANLPADSVRDAPPVSVSLPSPIPAAGSASPVFPDLSVVSILAALLWGIGALALLLRLGFGLIRLSPQARQATPATTAAPLLTELTTMLGLRKMVRLLAGTSDRSGLSPMTWGFFRPVILLPAESAAWSPHRLRPVLLHELAHIQRGDWANELLAQVVCALYWPNPFVWMLARRQRTESEFACDDRVLLAGIAPTDYAEQLLALVRLLKGQRERSFFPINSVRMAHRSGVEGRVRAILSPTPSRRPATLRMTAAALVAAVALLLPLASLRRAAAGDTKASSPGTVVQKQTAPDAPATPKPVTLPGGILVEFLPVRGNLADGTPAMWQPDGSHLAPITSKLFQDAPPDPPYTNGLCSLSVRVSYPTEAERQKSTLAFGVKSALSRTLSESSPEPGAGIRVDDDFTRPKTRKRGLVLSTFQRFTATRKEVTMQLWVASGPRKTIIAGPPTRETTLRLPTGDTARISAAYQLPEPQPTAGRKVRFTVVKVTVPSRFDGLHNDYDLLPFDTTGKPLPIHNRGVVVPGLNNSLRFSFRTDELPPTKLKEFRFVARPFQKIEFPNIRLQPNNAKALHTESAESIKIGDTTFYNGALPMARFLADQRAKKAAKSPLADARAYDDLRFAPGSDRFPNGVVAEGLSVTGIGSNGTVSSWDRAGNLLSRGPNWRGSRLKSGELRFQWDRLKLPDMPAWIDKTTYERLRRTRDFESESGIAGSFSTDFGVPRSRIVGANGDSYFIESFTAKRSPESVTVDLYLTTSYGPWQTLATSSRLPEIPDPAPKSGVTLSPLTTRRGGVEAELVAHLPARFLSKDVNGRPQWSLRLEPVDAAGQIVGSPRIARYDETPKGKATAQLRFRFLTSELPFAKVASVRLLARPVQTLYFRNVPTQSKPMPRTP